MTDRTDRREFLLKLAKGAVYTAPVVRSLAAPTHLAAQVSPKMMGMKMMFMFPMGFMFMKGKAFTGPFRAPPAEPNRINPPWSSDE